MCIVLAKYSTAWVELMLATDFVSAVHSRPLIHSDNTSHHIFESRHAWSEHGRSSGELYTLDGCWRDLDLLEISLRTPNKAASTPRCVRRATHCRLRAVVSRQCLPSEFGCRLHSQNVRCWVIVFGVVIPVQQPCHRWQLCRHLNRYLAPECNGSDISTFALSLPLWAHFLILDMW